VVYHCRVCGRTLTNPFSIKLGVGSACRLKEKSCSQGEFDFMRAHFEVVKHKQGEYIYIHDVGRNCSSVTNDAEFVVERLVLDYDITDKIRIFYKDTDGQINELLHYGKKFTGFRVGHEGFDIEVCSMNITNLLS